MDKTKFFYKKLHLTIEVAVAVNGPDELVSDDELREVLDRELNKFEDGRQDFGVECFKDGLSRALKVSMERAVFENACRRYPDRRWHDGTSFSCKLSDHKMARLHDIYLTRAVEVVGLKPVEDD